MQTAIEAMNRAIEDEERSQGSVHAIMSEPRDRLGMPGRLRRNPQASLAAALGSYLRAVASVKNSPGCEKSGLKGVVS